MIKRKHDKKKTHFLTTGLLLLLAFALWTLLIQIVDVRPAGETATDVGFATLNSRFHGLTGVHMTLYHITDWLGLVPVFVCLCFGVLGLCQWIRRKKPLESGWGYPAAGCLLCAGDFSISCL